MQEKSELRDADLVPRMKDQGYSEEQVAQRRAWVETKTGVSLQQIAAATIPGESMRGNIENPIGTVQMPVGIAGPLRVNGMAADGVFYVPLATTEGALVRSYERGMALLTRAGGATTRVYIDENRITPVFCFEDVGKAHAFAMQLPDHFEAIRVAAESTTRHGKLLRIETYPVGREVQVNFCYHTGDAQGMNMIAKATHAGCQWIMTHLPALRYYIFSGFSSEKRASGFLLPGGKGKKVVAGALLPAGLLRLYLHVSPQQLFDLWHRTMLGHLNAHTVGYNGHFANGLTAMFIACGQDVANVANASVGITNFEITATGDLYASVTLPSLTVATVGGGTGLGTSRECLQLLDCYGGGKAVKLAEIMAASALAGELSMGAAIASGEFVDAHETYGRNRPQSE
ncbi:MAG: hydroxymethylglutaryl-CoA reductase [candidate division Zixibacteria bacterium]|nr:hydroxymethylglutaryl-CoA reductase [candidate division Zixibacteria bacterium]